jgi:hypothetical protein
VEDKAAADKAAMDRAAAQKVIDDKAAKDLPATDLAKAGADRANDDVVRAKPDAEQTPQEPVNLTAAAALAYAAAESRISFVYGLISGPIVFCFGGVVFLLLSRRRSAAVAQHGERIGRMTAAEQQRRDGRPRSPGVFERQRFDEAGLH